MRLGFYGGTFDPIHLGHLDVARAARRALALDRLSLLPAHTPPHRASPHASSAHRFAMAALAVQDDAGVEVSDLDMVSIEPSYTNETLDRLSRGGIDTRQVYFITGADAFADIASWRGYPALLDRCHFAVVSRPGRSVAALRGALPALAPRMVDAPLDGGMNPPAETPMILLIDAPTAPISSTDVRARRRQGGSIADMVPAAVERHIITNRLYERADRQRPRPNYNGSGMSKSEPRKTTTRVKPKPKAVSQPEAKPRKRAASSRLPAEVKTALAAAFDKKAENVLVLDLRTSSAFTDFFIICTATNVRQAHAVADGIEEALRKKGTRPALVEGTSRSEWVLMDYFDFIVHVFTPQMREFYSLEKLWGDAIAIEIADPDQPAS